MDKRDKEIFIPLRGSRYLAMLSELLRRAATSVNGRIVYIVQDIEQESKNSNSKQERGRFTYILYNQCSTNFVF